MASSSTWTLPNRAIHVNAFRLRARARYGVKRSRSPGRRRAIPCSLGRTSALTCQPAVRTPGLAWSVKPGAPAIIACVQDGVSGQFLGVHRTFIPPEHGECAPVRPPWLALGPIKGGACRLGPVSDTLIIAETLEDGLTEMQGRGWTAWAALSAPNLGVLDLPDVVRNVFVTPRSDPGFNAAEATARRWRLEGRQVVVTDKRGAR